jgi:DNA polymerase-3 subunit gamma/tau
VSHQRRGVRDYSRDIAGPVRPVPRVGYRQGVATALYRRYRSARFADLVGQEVIATTLRNEVRDGALAHAYLFTGIRGTGKTSTARILARAVNCLQPSDGEPCNECVACREILDSSSVDVLEIDAASNRGIDEMRDLREKVRYLPSSLRRKVYIIDEAHMLTPEAWNAFLKTLEEPPPHVLFVLATTEPHKVPETVRSRVQRFDFRRVSTTDLVRHLENVLVAEGTEGDAAALALLARAAQGSVRDALSMLDQTLAGGQRPVRAEHVRRALGLADPTILFDLLRALAGADGAAALRAVAGAFETGADPRQLLRETGRLARAAEFAALGYADGADVSVEEGELVVVLARIAPAGFWLRALELIQSTSIELRQPIDARLQVEFCVMRLVREGALGAEALSALEDRVDALEGRGVPDARSARETAATAAPRSPATTAPAPVAAPPAASPTPPPPVEVAAAAAGTSDATPEVGEDTSVAQPAAGAGGKFVTAVEWQDSWPLVIEAVNRQDPMLAGILRDCRALSADEGGLVVGAKHNFHLEKLRQRGNLAVIAAVAGEVAGGPREVTAAYVGEPSPSVTRRPSGTDETTQAVLDAFMGSRVTSTRLRDDAPSAPRGGAA